MPVKQREYGERHSGHGSGPKKEHSVTVDSVAALPEINAMMNMVTVVGREGSERHFIRHKNQNLVAGGFVESTATVDPKVFIDKSSTVEEEAIVTGDAKLINHSRVYGKATVKGRSTINNSEVFDEVVISGTSLVKNSSISGNYTYNNTKIENKVKSDRA
jgi:NDP-sugar pyrophosphorylase family protein